MPSRTCSEMAALLGGTPRGQPFVFRDGGRVVIRYRVALGFTVASGLKLSHYSTVGQKKGDVRARPVAGGAERPHLLLDEFLQDGALPVAGRRQLVNPFDGVGSLR